MGFKWASNGLQMGFKWASNGLQMGFKCVLQLSEKGKVVFVIE
jgi:hypothetical protein